MIPRILSIAGPVLVYVTLAILVTGLWHERRKLEWLALAPAAAGLLASFVFLAPVHRLFFDEDAYISIAQNLTRAPVAQITLAGAAATRLLREAAAAGCATVSGFELFLEQYWD